jgi:3-mercaptopyruvate sulfurtransferase SseA
MRSFLAGLATALLAAAALTACQNAASETPAPPAVKTNAPAQTQPAAAPEPADGVKRVTVDDARAAVDKGTGVIIDVRSDDDYKKRHIKGALSIPYTEIEARMGELPKDKLAILYCS